MLGLKIKIYKIILSIIGALEVIELFVCFLLILLIWSGNSKYPSALELKNNLKH